MGYIVVENKVLENRLAFVTPFTTVQLVAVIMLVLLVLEATRRLTGLTLPIACLIFWRMRSGETALLAFWAMHPCRPNVFWSRSL